MPRIGIYGWGVVAPRSPDIATFAANLEDGDSWLSPFADFGPSNFLVGNPAFDFSVYRPWIEERFPPNKYPQLRQKMGATTQYAIGAFIQALGQNPGIDRVLRELGTEAQVLVGTGLGELPTIYEAALEADRSQRVWDRFWAHAERNEDRACYEAADTEERQRLREGWGVPPDPRAADDFEERERLRVDWNRFWRDRSDGLARFLERLDAVEAEGVEGEVEQGKLRVMRRKRTAAERLKKEYGCPTPPWLSVSSNVLWNIHNTPASQISMLGKITGAAWAPVAACSTFGVSLRLAMNEIREGRAKAVVMGAADPPPHTLSVGAFYAARVLSASQAPSIPLTDLRGTHVSGGACVWVVGDHEFMSARGFAPVGLELLGVGLTSDADHIITPSAEGPRESVRQALKDAGVSADEIRSWDLHATATPGDFQEVANLGGILDEGILLTARKGTFGHGMSCCGGWELMAQHLGLSQGRLHPTPLAAESLNSEVADLPFRHVMDQGCPAEPGAAGKLSMGVGGINACVISRPW